MKQGIKSQQYAILIGLRSDKPIDYFYMNEDDESKPDFIGNCPGNKNERIIVPRFDTLDEAILKADSSGDQRGRRKIRGVVPIDMGEHILRIDGFEGEVRFGNHVYLSMNSTSRVDITKLYLGSPLDIWKLNG
jgi:hypothetical protein